MKYIKILIILLLIGGSCRFLITYLSGAIGIDFYHYWAIPTVLKIYKEPIGNPYSNLQNYTIALRQYAGQSFDDKLKSVQRYRDTPDFTGSPFLYAFFSFLPKDYSTSLVTFQIIEIFLFFSALIVLSWDYKHNTMSFPIICLCFLLFLFFKPLEDDLIAGNINILQLFCIVIIISLLNYSATIRSFRKAVIVGVIFFSLLYFLILIKINLLIVAIVLAIYWGVNKGIKVFAFSFGPSLIVLCLLVSFPCLYFDRWAIWGDWLKYFHSWSDLIYLGDDIKLGYPSLNYSFVIILSHWTGLHVRTVMTCMIGILGGSLISVVLIKKKSGNRLLCFSAYLKQLIDGVFKDLDLVVAIGISLTIAIAPLMWNHYYVFVIIPALWLMNKYPNSYQGLFGMISILLCSGMGDSFFYISRVTRNFIPIFPSLSWIPIWGAILVHILNGFSNESLHCMRKTVSARD